MYLNSSPYGIAKYEDGSLEICFAVDGKDVVKLKFDRDNAYKLAIELLQPHIYEPKMENFIISQCQSQ